MVRETICGAIRHKLIPTPQNLVTSTPLTTTGEFFLDYIHYLKFWIKLIIDQNSSWEKIELFGSWRIDESLF
ncbi:hypothetical protein PHAVU_005G048600 [Phaseolus vulgaris]|uniref:Uncharacterized protein n=1 Tax=Phaseolus vulgaris TaxID=3885 RepID=V7BVX1_PHAVU|nr:hypothetical protein PHAVU_005G048600g [Phaseolus vulgaris]ESW21178.1 hypothetical protein PHAVU_005G048600g [Phaseolus vulgaris]